MTIERNLFIKLAAKVIDKRIIYKVHNNFLEKRSKKVAYKPKTDERNDNEVVKALNTNGIYRTNLQKLSFIQEEQEGLSNEYNNWANKLSGFSSNSKFYEHKMNPHPLTILNQNSWLTHFATDERIVKIAQSYFGNQGCSLFYADYWHTIPSNENRIASQMWHRDLEDSRLLKVFIYLNDIGENNGCLEFLMKTSNGLEFDTVEPRFKVTQSILANKDTHKFITENSKLLFKGVVRKYDVIFCDTTGFHRGGFVKEGVRKIVNLIYVSKNCPHIYYSVKNKDNKLEKFNF